VTADIVFLKKRAIPMTLDRTNTPSWIQTDMERGKWISYNPAGAIQGWGLLYLMASHPVLAEKVERYFSPDGIDFGGLMKKEEFDYDWMKLTADAARNLFSWNSKCAATPFEISRMPAPAIQAIYTSFFIANGDYTVSVRENEDGKKEFVMDDSARREREKIRQQFDRMLADIGSEMG